MLLPTPPADALLRLSWLVRRHAAAAAMLYWECYNSIGLWRPRLMLTIHNLDNTGEVRQVRCRWAFGLQALDGSLFD